MDRVEMVTESGCWIWTGYVNTPGYGQFYDAGCHLARHTGYVSAHRWSVNFFKGQIKADDHVCHSCDVPCCVNPNHLWVGTHQDNMADLWAKGRGTKGRRFPERDKSNCKHGHPYTPENTIYAGAKKAKRCKICSVRRKKQDWLKHRDEIRERQKQRYRERKQISAHI